MRSSIYSWNRFDITLDGFVTSRVGRLRALNTYLASMRNIDDPINHNFNSPLYRPAQSALAPTNTVTKA